MREIEQLAAVPGHVARERVAEESRPHRLEGGTGLSAEEEGEQCCSQRFRVRKLVEEVEEVVLAQFSQVGHAAHWA